MEDMSLEELFRKCEESEAEFDREFSDLFENMDSYGHYSTSNSNHTTQNYKNETISGKVESPVQRKKNDIDVHQYTEEDIQVYMLRTEYLKSDRTPSMERQMYGAFEPMSAWREESVYQYHSSELYMKIQTALSTGRMEEECIQGIECQLQREHKNQLFNKYFFSIWSNIQMRVSKPKMREWISLLPNHDNSEDYHQHGLFLLKKVLAYTLEIVEHADRIKEQGCRNRLEALERALKEAENSYNRAHSNLINHRY